MPKLPHGTVTLVFTDVEGSTQLLQRLGDTTPTSSTTTAGSFATPSRRAAASSSTSAATSSSSSSPMRAPAGDAVVAAQRAFAEHDWPSGADLRVRMGLHTGEPNIRDGTYFGLDVHRAARICQAGSGGQILISRERASSSRPAHEVEDLGDHQLPGIDQPERLYQLNADRTADRFPPLSTARRGFRGCACSACTTTPSCCAKASRGCSRTPASRSSRRAGTADDLLAPRRHAQAGRRVVDIRMPPTQTDEGLRAAQEIRERWPDTGVLVLSQYVEPAYAMELLGENAEGVGYPAEGPGLRRGRVRRGRAARGGGRLGSTRRRLAAGGPAPAATTRSRS
jgi:class 3 adenylate cyclase